MRRRLMLAVAVAALAVAPAAVAQDGRTEGTDRVPSTEGRTERTPGKPGTPGTPGTDRIPSTQGRTERTPGTPGTPRPGTKLPETGNSAVAAALDGLTLLGAGTLMLRYRRRLLA